ncbi:mannose-6-phosphate isomerase, partial [Paenibacillus sp. Aloe-11]
LNGERFTAVSGSVFRILVDTHHTIRADQDKPLELIEVRLGESLVGSFYKPEA